MPKTTRTTVREDDEGYFDISIPKALGDAMRLEGGDQVEWDIESSNSLKMTKVEE